jgi:hypothetical protein
MTSLPRVANRRCVPILKLNGYARTLTKPRTRQLTQTKAHETSPGNNRDEKAAYTETETASQANARQDVEQQYQDPGPAPDGGWIAWMVGELTLTHSITELIS